VYDAAPIFGQRDIEHPKIDHPSIGLQRAAQRHVRAPTSPHEGPGDSMNCRSVQ